MDTGQSRGHGQRIAALLRVALQALPPAAELALDELPWLVNLDEPNARQFIEEYASAYSAALESGEWQALDDLLGEWHATAEAFADPELVHLLAGPSLPPNDRVPLDYPE
jgi:hypothetical protein